MPRFDKKYIIANWGVIFQAAWWVIHFLKETFGLKCLTPFTVLYCYAYCLHISVCTLIFCSCLWSSSGSDMDRGRGEIDSRKEL